MKNYIYLLALSLSIFSCTKETEQEMELSKSDPISIESVTNLNDGGMNDGLGGGFWYDEIDLESGFYQIEWFRSEENFPSLGQVVDTTWGDVGAFMFYKGTMFTVYNGAIQILPSYIGYAYSLNHTFGASIQQASPTDPKVLYAGDAWVITPINGGFELTNHTSYGLMGFQRRTMFLRQI